MKYLWGTPESPVLEAESEMELSCSATVHPVASDLLSCPESVRTREWDRESVLLHHHCLES